MSLFSGNGIVALAVFAVFCVLVMGFINMFRGGSANTSQMLMRWRVTLQFIAIIIIALVIMFRKG